MENKNKNLWIGAVVVLVIIIGLWLMNKSSTPATTTEEETGKTDTALESTQDLSEIKGFVPAASIAYADALVKYKDRRIQLDPVCQAHPNTVTYKDNTGIMIDNRSALTRTVKVGTTFSIKPWGFKIVILPDVTLKAAKTILVDCDTSQNVATVLVQE